MTFREKCSLAVQTLRESMTFCWHNRVLWKYVGLIFFAVTMVVAGAFALSSFLSKTLSVVILTSVLVVELFWIMFAFWQKVVALLQVRTLSFCESFKGTSQFVWQYMIGTFLISCAYSCFVLPIRFVSPATTFYWFLLPIAVVGYWIIVLIAELFTPILFSERIYAVQALKRAALMVKSYWNLMTLANIFLFVVLFVPLMLLVLTMNQILFGTLSIVLSSFIILWLLYALLVMFVFWFIFYDKIKRA